MGRQVAGQRPAPGRSASASPRAVKVSEFQLHSGTNVADRVGAPQVRMGSSNQQSRGRLHLGRPDHIRIDGGGSPRAGSPKGSSPKNGQQSRPVTGGMESAFNIAAQGALGGADGKWALPVLGQQERGRPGLSESPQKKNTNISGKNGQSQKSLQPKKQSFSNRLKFMVSMGSTPNFQVQGSSNNQPGTGSGQGPQQ